MTHEVQCKCKKCMMKKNMTDDFGSNIVGSTKDVVAELESYSESGFTKNMNKSSRKKDDPFGNVGL